MKLLQMIFIATLAIFTGNTGHATPVSNVAMYSLQGERIILHPELEKLNNGQKLIINFTSIYCKPCREEIPEILEIVRKNPDKVKAIFIVSEGSNEIAEKPQGKIFLGMFKAKGMDPAEFLFTDVMGTVKEKNEVKATPCTVVVDKQKNVLMRIRGYKKTNSEQIEKAIHQ